jgi:galactokinase
LYAQRSATREQGLSRDHERALRIGWTDRATIGGLPLVFTTESLRDAHRRKWGGSSEDVKVYRAPGRVSLLGEHTDYTEGFVLAVAVDLACYVTRSKNASGELRVISENNGQERRWPISALPVVQPMQDWSDHVVGVAKEMFRAGYPVEPANLRVHSAVPMGAGMGSSAALGVATALAFLDGRGVPEAELRQLCRRAESRFVGVPCSGTEQYAAAKAEAGRLLAIDSRSFESRTVAWPAEIAVVVVDSMVRGQSAGRARAAECAEARERLGVRSLRDATMEQAATLAGDLGRRARHVVSENARVHAFLAMESAAERGQLLLASHASLRDDYAVSCPELDRLVDLARGLPGVYGARMTGSGGGGCTVNLVEAALAPQFEEAIQAGYQMAYGVEPSVYRCSPSAGASRQI